MAKIALFWRKKSQKMADFCGFLGEIWVFLWFAPFPAPRNCKILWVMLGEELTHHASSRRIGPRRGATCDGWVISAGIQLTHCVNLCHFALLHKLILRINWIPPFGGMTIQAVCSVNDSPFLGAELYPPCPMFLCVYKKQLCEFAICGKITENQERIKCRCLTNLQW